MNTERKNDQIMPQEAMAEKERLYHITREWLRNYRRVGYIMQIIESDLTEMTPDDICLKLSILRFRGQEITGNMYDKWVEYNIKTLLDGKKTMAVLRKAAEYVKNYPGKGEVFYRILYLTYLTPKEKKRKEILRELADEDLEMSMNTYEKYLRQAVLIVSELLWGYATGKSGDWEAWIERENIRALCRNSVIYSSAYRSRSSAAEAETGEREKEPANSGTASDVN